MTARPWRSPLPQDTQREQVVYELAPLPLAGRPVGVLLSVRRDPDGGWRARLTFATPGGRDLETAEIFRAASEAELWAAVRSLGEHHLRALYLSLS